METIITIENAFIVMAIIGAFLILRLCISINFLPPIEEAIKEAIDEEKQETIDEEEQETIDEEEIKTKVIMTYIAYHNIILLGFLLILPLATYNVIKSHNWLSWLGFCITFLVGLNSSLKINNLFFLYSEKYTN